jgi:hypothetical protein
MGATPRITLAALAALALAACEQTPTPPPATTAAAAPPAAAAPAPAGLDGTYRGTWTVRRDETGQCNNPALPNTMVTVSGSTLTVANRQLGHRLNGHIEPDGTFSAAGTISGIAATFGGQVQGGTMFGLLTSRSCVFAARLTR